MGIRYGVTFEVTITCERCGRESYAEDPKPDTHKTSSVESGTRWMALERQAKAEIGAKDINLAGTQGVMCSDCMVVLTSVAAPTAASMRRGE